MAVHGALAAMTGVKELALEEAEARKLSEATKEVIKHYPIGVSDKQLAWINLGVVAFGVYGTRVMAFNVRRAADRRARVAAMPPPAPEPTMQTS